jgi:hypothetical protein
MKNVNLPLLSRICWIADQISGPALGVLFALNISGIIDGAYCGIFIIGWNRFTTHTYFLCVILVFGTWVKTIFLQKKIDQI